MYRRVAESGHPERLEAYHVPIGKWIEAAAVRTSVGVAVVARDVSDRKEAQHATEQSEREFRRIAEIRERLIAVVGHDLRNPLGAIMTAIQMIERHAGVPAAVVRLATRALSSAKRMARMIDQLLDYVRIEQRGGVVLDLQRADLGAMATRAVQESELAFPGHTFKIHLETGDLSGEWDDELTAQVIANLLRNAVEHGEGDVSVVVRGDAGAVSLEVRNRGTIPAGAFSRLFEPFSSGNASQSRRTGLGLGLYIAKQIVDAHGGQLEVRSGDGETAFRFQLPRTAPR
jgi:signal transduction histidine kinase